MNKIATRKMIVEVFGALYLKQITLTELRRLFSSIEKIKWSNQLPTRIISSPNYVVGGYKTPSGIYKVFCYKLNPKSIFFLYTSTDGILWSKK